jgi:hypothetical protein
MSLAIFVNREDLYISNNSLKAELIEDVEGRELLINRIL